MNLSTIFFTSSCLAKKLILLVLGIIFMSYGVNLIILADLGVSPISSVPYILNLITGYSVGVTTVFINVIFVLLQIIILKKEFRIIDLLQVFVAFTLGAFIDWTKPTLFWLSYSNYFEQWLICLLSVIFTAFGISLEIGANLTYMPGEGIVLAVCHKFNLELRGVKIGNDVTMVIITAILSFSFFHYVTGIREGSLFSMIFVGVFLKIFNKFMLPLAKRILQENSE